LPLDGAPAWAAATAVVVGLTLGGLWLGAGGRAYSAPDKGSRALDFVRATKARGDVYLVPVQTSDLVASDLQSFRLQTGAPVFVDYKCIPYKGSDVLEWHARIRLAQEVQGLLRGGQLPDALALLRGRGVTHLVVPVGQELRIGAVEKLFVGTRYQMFRLKGVPDGR
jgi:hypothetical protein